ncbi:MAG: methionyl-tRNA formyltransferase [Muribaculaceae bacterium]|nr:methionyl-tRNA formyltransferase [Muribaculaceae bacterium]
MEKNDLRIVFFGTPDFAVESLSRLVDGGYNVVAVVTMPDKAGGRGNHVIHSAVKQYALAHNLPLLQPVNLKDDDFVARLRACDAQLFIVIAFRMLPQVVWQMPPLGTFNLHASLLPKYRGAAPINWAVMNGDKRTGVTTFFLKHEIDTGDIIQQRAIDIARTDNVGDIHDRLMMLGADMVADTVEAILAGNVKTIAQEQLVEAGAEATPAPKIFKDTCRINWQRSGEEVYNHVRGLSPFPTAWTELVNSQGKRHTIKVYATGEPEPAQMPPGTILSDGKCFMKVAAGDATVPILELQLAGKRRMNLSEFLRGFKIDEYHCE